MTFQSNLAARVNAAVDKAIAEKRLVGAVALIARDGELVYRRAADWRTAWKGGRCARTTCFASLR